MNGKNKSHLLSQWWFWLIISVLFLAGVQFAFSCPAPTKWLDAVWEAGDLISFCGTIVLGFVAWKQSKMATETSEKLINFQAAEYLPTITMTDFLGITKFAPHFHSDEITSDIALVEMKTKDNKLLFGYAAYLVDEKLDKGRTVHCRAYELHLKYFGKSIISYPKIVAIQFSGHKIDKRFEINQKIDLSLQNDAELMFWIYVMSNDDFLADNSEANKWIKASKMIVYWEMETLTHNVFSETLEVTKHFVASADSEMEDENTERLVSSSYRVIEK